MNDDQKTGGVRRFGRRDRKRSLDPRGPLFPPEELNEQADIVEEDADSDSAEVPPVPLVEPTSATKVQNTAIQPTLPSATGTKESSGGKHIMANLLTVLFLLGTVGLIALIGLITTNPYTPLNPFPPFTPLPIVITATFLPPTQTPEGTLAPTATFTPVAINAGSTSQVSFALVHTQPVYAPNANDKGCNWSSIAGTVVDNKGAALDGYRVRIKGKGINETVFSGATATFGAGGFELFLNGTPQEQTYTVQLFDPQSRPLSDPYDVTTKASCDQNVAVLEFTQQP